MLNKFRNVLYGSPMVNGEIERDQTNSRIVSHNQSMHRQQIESNSLAYMLENILDPRHSDKNSRNKSSRHHNEDYSPSSTRGAKFRYCRPNFLQLKSDEEILVSADHIIRPIILPRDVSRLPWKAGYAECVNAGKSSLNEDQAVTHQDVAIQINSKLAQSDGVDTTIEDQCPWTYFGIFDGHAGDAVAVAASMQLHSIIGRKLDQIAELLLRLEFDSDVDDDSDTETEQVGFQGERRTEKDTDDNDNVNGVNGDDNDNETREKINGGENTQDSTQNMSAESSDCSARDEENNINGDKTILTEEQQGDDKLQAACAMDEGEIAATKEKETIHQSPTESQMEPAVSRVRKAKSEYELRKNQARAKSKPSAFDDAWESRTSRRPMNRDSVLDVSDNISKGFTLLEWCRRKITVDELIIGTLESAFWEMDALIGQDKSKYRMPGGCTANVALFILGKLYVCNAGDSRAIVSKNNINEPDLKDVRAMSYDFTPISDKERIQRIGFERPEFMGSEFTHLEFLVKPTIKHLGKKMLYRDAHMNGWALKTVNHDDLKFPLVWGEGKRSRALATIGVTRGFGDHELRSHRGSVAIKPFLTPEPDVRVLPLEHDRTLTPECVLIMGTDGLWDVTSNWEAANIVEQSFKLFPENDESRSKYRYITAAQDLVIHARGLPLDKSQDWRRPDGEPASLDDIAVFVVPLKQYRDEYVEWKRARETARQRNSRRQ